MKSILISIQPQWVEKILKGEKTIEIRKTIPKCMLPCKVYIYMTKKRNFFMANRKGEEIWFGDGLRYDKTEIVKYPKCDVQYWHLLGKVVAEFILNKTEEYEFELWDNETFESIGKVYYDEETREREVDVFASCEDIEKTEFVNSSQLSVKDLRKYLGTGFQTCYAWHIDDLKIYNKPKELSEFYKNNYKKIIEQLEFDGCEEKHCKYAVGNSFLGDDGYCDYSMCPKLRLKRPPQSWCYVEECNSERN